MIPNIQPPPFWLPQGWSPNALRPTDAQVAQQVINQQTTILNSFSQPALGAVGGLSLLTTLITNAQIKSLNGAPVIVVPAVAEFVIIPFMMFSMSRCPAGGVAWDQTVNAVLKYQTKNGGAALATFNLVSLNQDNGDIRNDWEQPIDTTLTANEDLANEAVVINNNGVNPTVGDGIAYVTVIYALARSVPSS